MRSSGWMLLRTISTMRASWPSPRSAKYSVCRVMKISGQAASALTVSRPRLGGQSTITQSYRAWGRASIARRRRASRPGQPAISTSTPARSSSAGATSRPGVAVGTIVSARVAPEASTS